MTSVELLTWTLSAALASSPTVAAAREKPQVPFGFTLGVTRLDEARARWTDGGVRVLGQGAATTGASALPTSAWGPADRIQIVQVADVSFEGVPARPANFTFFDGVLFHVMQSFRPALKSEEKEFPPKEKDPLDPKVLEQALRRRFGPPAQSEKTILEGTVLTWRFEGKTFVFLRGGIPAGVMMVDEKLAKAANAYRKALADQERAKKQH
jgi:hypothetical protein